VEFGNLDAILALTKIRAI